MFEARHRPSKSLGRFFATFVSASILVAPSAWAANGSWDNGGADNNWQTATNWTSDVLLGTTSGFANADTATFSTTGSGSINLGNLVNIQNINLGAFNGNANAFTIGDADDTLNLTTAGAITMGTGVTNTQQIGVSGTTINLANGATQAYSFVNNSGTSAAKLNVAGNIVGNSSAITTLTLTGLNGGTVSGDISNGSGGGTVALTKSGLGAWTLTGTNTYTGNTTINGGTIDLGGGGSTGSLSGGVLTLGISTNIHGGTLNYTRTGTNTQTFSGTTLAAGASAVNAAVSTGTVKLTAITRQFGGTINFTGPGTITTSSANTNGILSGWATVNGTDWAVANGANSAITAYSGYTASTAGTTAPGTTSNVDFQASNSTAWNTQTINSVRFNTAAATTLTVGSGQALTVASGGILVTSAVGNNATTITGGTLTGGGTGELIITQNNTSNSLIIDSVIVGSSATDGLTKTGAGTLVLNGANTYLGRTYVTGGTVKLGSATAFGDAASTAAITFATGSTLDFNGIAPTLVGRTINFFGSGITNSSATAVNFTNNWVGIGVTVPGAVNAVDGVGDITFSGSINSGRLVKNGSNTLTITGANTNTGTTLVANSGTVILNSATADGALRGIDLYGNVLTVNGGTVQLGANDQIRNAADVSTGGVAVYGGTFDINSKNETINGLQIGSTDGATAGNVISTGGAGTLTITGGSASTAFGVNSIHATNGTVSAKLAGTGATFTKTTAQTVTLSGANTYTGATSVNAGTLSVTGSLASGSAVGVASGATLRGTGTIGGATTIASGGIVAAGINASTIGTLTFNSTLAGSGSTFSLKLNSTAGTFDLITAAGAVTLGSSTLSLIDIGSGAWTGTTSAFSIVHGSSITGVFLGLSNGATVNVGSNIFTLNYGASDVTLTFVSAIPEPATYATILGALALGGVVWSRRRRSAVRA